jgi:hypothetical protein
MSFFVITSLSSPVLFVLMILLSLFLGLLLSHIKFLFSQCSRSVLITLTAILSFDFQGYVCLYVEAGLLFRLFVW